MSNVANGPLLRGVAFFSNVVFSMAMNKNQFYLYKFPSFLHKALFITGNYEWRRAVIAQSL
jgi:hypothetical protein